ncbi:GNAT superfamily N-acetyltransferase [Elusimicrobium posterum]|uniref:GNAT family N-acetyltransferase n=1 Tax=Elusimicrobium posterum TaxID=3116653 RepID=UPI003C7880B8
MQTINIITEYKQYLPLLMLADPDEKMLNKYITRSDIYVLKDGDTAISIAAVLPLDDKKVELKNFATAPEYQNKGYARQVLNHIFDVYSKSHSFMLVGTADNGVPFYEKFGFVYSHTVKDFFVKNYPAPIYDEGVQCIDMIYLSKKL